MKLPAIRNILFIQLFDSKEIEMYTHFYTVVDEQGELYFLKNSKNQYKLIRDNEIDYFYAG